MKGKIPSLEEQVYEIILKHFNYLDTSAMSDLFADLSVVFNRAHKEYVEKIVSAQFSCEKSKLRDIDKALNDAIRCLEEYKDDQTII